MTGHAVMPGHGQELPVSAWPTGASGGGAPQSSVHIGTRGGSVVASGSSLCRCDDGARGANAGDDIGSQTRRAVAAGAAEAAIIGQRRGAGGGGAYRYLDGFVAASGAPLVVAMTVLAALTLRTASAARPGEPGPQERRRRRQLARRRRGCGAGPHLASSAL